MSDIDVASALLDQIVEPRGRREQISSVIERAYSALTKQSNKWTRRRVKSIWYRETSRVEWREIEDMRLILEAKKKHEEYIAETAVLASRYSREDAAYARLVDTYALRGQVDQDA